MGLFDAIQNLLGSVTEGSQDSIGDITGGMQDIIPVQELLDQATGLKEGLNDSASSVTEQGQNVIESINNNLNL